MCLSSPVCLHLTHYPLNIFYPCTANSLLILLLFVQVLMSPCHCYFDGDCTLTLPCIFVNLQVGLKQCLEDFKKNLKWVERLDMTNGPATDIIAKAEGKCVGEDNSNIDPEDDFQREMYL